MSLYRPYMWQESSCMACPSGHYCSSAALTAPSGHCSAGFYCLAGASSPSPPGELYCVNISVFTCLCPIISNKTALKKSPFVAVLLHLLLLSHLGKWISFVLECIHSKDEKVVSPPVCYWMRHFHWTLGEVWLPAYNASGLIPTYHFIVHKKWQFLREEFQVLNGQLNILQNSAKCWKADVQKYSSLWLFLWSKRKSTRWHSTE